MHDIQERKTYKLLGKEVETFRVILSQNPHFSIQQLQSAYDAWEALIAAIAIQRQQMLGVADVYIAIRDHKHFWRTTELPVDILDAIEHNRPVADNFVTRAERDYWCDYLFRNITRLQQAPEFISVRQAVAARQLDGSTLPGKATVQSVQDALTDRVLFNRQAIQHGFTTETDQTKYRHMMLKHWLSIQMTQCHYDAFEQFFRNIVNASDDRVRNILRSFAEVIQDGNPNRIDPADYTMLDDATIDFLRMQALERIINAQHDLTIVQRIADEEYAIFQHLHITDLRWMTVQNQEKIKNLAEARLLILERDPSEKKANQQIFNRFVKEFIRSADNQKFYSQTQGVVLKKMFEFCTRTEQQKILKKIQIDANRFLAQIFHAKTPDALRFYLGLEASNSFSDANLNVLTSCSHKGVVICGEFAKYLTDYGIDFDPVRINHDLIRCYKRMAANDQNAIPKFERALARHIQVNQPNLLHLPQSLKNFLKKSARVFNQIRSTRVYQHNQIFCDYLLSLPGFSSALPRRIPRGSKLSDTVLKLVTQFQNAKTLDAFKHALTDFPEALQNSFIHMQDTEFRELKNIMLQEHLKHAGNPNDKARDAVIAKTLKRGHEQILKPLRDEFRLSQKTLTEFGERMLAVRKLIKADMGVREFASAHKEEVTRDLSGLITIAQKMEWKLARHLTKLKDYQHTLGVAAAENNIRTPAFKHEFGTVMRHRKELEEACDAWRQFRQDTGLLSKEEHTPMYPSVYVDIITAEKESAHADSARFPFTASKIKTIEAVEIEGYQTPIIQPEEINEAITSPEQFTLTKPTDFMPVLKKGQMYEMRIPYVNQAQKQDVVIFTRQSHDDGRFTTSLRKPATTEKGKLELISQAEWAIYSQKRGNKFSLSGKAGYVATMYLIFIRLGVPPALIDTKSASIYDPKDKVSAASIEAEAFSKIDGFQERIEESKRRLMEWRAQPKKAQIERRTIKARDLMKGIFADSEPLIKTADSNDYTALSTVI